FDELPHALVVRHSSLPLRPAALETAAVGDRPTCPSAATDRASAAAAPFSRRYPAPSPPRAGACPECARGRRRVALLREDAQSAATCERRPVGVRRRYSPVPGSALHSSEPRRSCYLSVAPGH